MDIDALLLSRLPFAATLTSHVIFPSFTLGLTGYLAVLECLWLGTNNEVFNALHAFWLKIFAVSVGMAVVTGVMLGYEIGAHWSLLSATIAPLIGPRPAFTALAVLFLVAGFLGIMLFGWRKVGARSHLAATLLVAVSAVALSFWVVSAVGGVTHAASLPPLAHGELAATDWRELVSSSGFRCRFAHMILAAYLATALVVGAASAWRLLKDPEEPASSTALRMAVGMVAIAAPLQLVTGDGRAGTIEVFRAYQVMVGLGGAMIVLGVWGAWLAWRNSLERSRLYLMAMVAMGPTGLISIVAGWRVPELARKPFAIHDVLRAAEAGASVQASPWHLGLLALHAITFGLGAYYVLRLIGRGPLGGAG